MTHLNDMKTFQLYKKLSPCSLPQETIDDPMAAAAAAERDSDLAFLSEPLCNGGGVPTGLLERAIALGPRRVRRAGMWKQITAAILTFLAFGSGSYALANGLSVNTPMADPLSTDTAGLFEAASSTGFFTYE